MHGLGVDARRPGLLERALGSLASETVARAKPDGNTLMSSVNTLVMNASLFRTLPYDPVADFAPIGLVATLPNVLAVHPDVPARSVQELVALAKKDPEKLTYSSSGVGGNNHLAGSSDVWPRQAVARWASSTER